MNTIKEIDKRLRVLNKKEDDIVQRMWASINKNKTDEGYDVTEYLNIKINELYPLMEEQDDLYKKKEELMEEESNGYMLVEIVGNSIAKPKINGKPIYARILIRPVLRVYNNYKWSYYED